MAPLSSLARSLEWRRLGFWVWLLRRLTGLAIALYLFLHIAVIYQLVAGRASFNEVMHIFASPIFRLGELGVVAACVVHGIDGIRIMIIEAFDLARAERRLLWASAAVAALLLTVGGIPLLLYLLGIPGKP